MEPVSRTPSRMSALPGPIAMSGSRTMRRRERDGCFGTSQHYSAAYATGTRSTQRARSSGSRPQFPILSRSRKVAKIAGFMPLSGRWLGSAPDAPSPTLSMTPHLHRGENQGCPREAAAGRRLVRRPAAALQLAHQRASPRPSTERSRGCGQGHQSSRLGCTGARPASIVGRLTAKRLPASLMSAPNSRTSVGISISPPATPSMEAATPMPNPAATPATT